MFEAVRAYAAVALVAVASLAACGTAYQPGSFTLGARSFTGERITVGCLDLAIARWPDRGKDAVLEYQFGNHCTRAQTIDLAFVRVVGRADGVEHQLRPWDPQQELRPLALDGRYAGSETIAYPSEYALGQVCVDVASLIQREPARWLCLSSNNPSERELAGAAGESQ